MEDPSRARVTGPLELHAAGFVAELARLGYVAWGGLSSIAEAAVRVL